jgi:hypothetical protein
VCWYKAIVKGNYLDRNIRVERNQSKVDCNLPHELDGHLEAIDGFFGTRKW